MKSLWKILNTFVINLAKSPLHWIISANILVLHVVGIKTGKLYKIPVSYLETEPGKLWCVTDRENLWWKNLTIPQDTEVIFQGKTVSTTIETSIDNKDQIEGYLEALCRHSKVDGFFANVRYKNGEPVKQDIEAAGKLMVAVTVKAKNKHQM